MLEQVSAGGLSVEDALARLASPESAADFATIDTHRLKRRGLPEVIYCPGKTDAQVIDIMHRLIAAGQNVLATRIDPHRVEPICGAVPGAVHHELARAITVPVTPPPPPIGMVAVVTAGTSDIPVAEEAALVAQCMGANVDRIYDVGVAGLHRLLAHVDRLRAARAVVVAAGMEGALPSVVGGLLDTPVIAVPTSVGYGTNLKGVSALLAMLNTCVPGVTVVNIDNGFGAGVAAAMINRIGEKDGAQ